MSLSHAKKSVPNPVLIPSSPFLPSEKSPLPAIIVTPSSPTSKADFSIAFLAPPSPPPPARRPSLFNFLLSTSPSPTKVGAGDSSLPSYMTTTTTNRAHHRLRTTILLAIPIAIIALHVISNKFELFGLYDGDSGFGQSEWLEHNSAIDATGL